MTQAQPVSIFHGPLVRQAIKDSLVKLSPAVMAKNPVMLVVEVGSVLTTLIWVRDLLFHPAGAAPAWFTIRFARAWGRWLVMATSRSCALGSTATGVAPSSATKPWTSR